MFQSIFRSNGNLLLIQHISGVQSCIHLHDGHTGLRLPVDDHSLDRRCPTVFRKQGCVDIQASVLRQIQDLLRQDLSEGCHNIDICGIFFNSSIASGVLIRRGWNTGMPCFTAHSFTGGNCNCPLLPFALSGWVTTAVISCPCAIKASRAPTAKSGVPINTICIAYLLPGILILLPHPHRSCPAEDLPPSPHRDVHPGDPVRGRWLLPIIPYPLLRWVSY